MKVKLMSADLGLMRSMVSYYNLKDKIITEEYFGVEMYVSFQNISYSVAGNLLREGIFVQEVIPQRKANEEFVPILPEVERKRVERDR